MKKTPSTENKETCKADLRTFCEECGNEHTEFGWYCRTCEHKKENEMVKELTLEAAF